MSTHDTLIEEYDKDEAQNLWNALRSKTKKRRLGALNRLCLALPPFRSLGEEEALKRVGWQDVLNVIAIERQQGSWRARKNAETAQESASTVERLRVRLVEIMLAVEEIDDQYEEDDLREVLRAIRRNNRRLLEDLGLPESLKEGEEAAEHSAPEPDPDLFPVRCPDCGVVGQLSQLGSARYSQEVRGVDLAGEPVLGAETYEEWDPDDLWCEACQSHPGAFEVADEDALSDAQQAHMMRAIASKFNLDEGDIEMLGDHEFIYRTDDAKHYYRFNPADGSFRLLDAK